MRVVYWENKKIQVFDVLLRLYAKVVKIKIKDYNLNINKKNVFFKKNRNKYSYNLNTEYNHGAKIIKHYYYCASEEDCYCNFKKKLKILIDKDYYYIILVETSEAF